MKHIILPILVSMFVALAACGDPETITISSGDFAEDLADAACHRGVTCGFQPASDVPVCIDVIVNETCNQVDCGLQITADYSDYHDCLNAFEDFACALLDEGTIPSECNTIMEF